MSIGLPLFIQTENDAEEKYINDWASFERSVMPAGRAEGRAEGRSELLSELIKQGVITEEQAKNYRN